MAKYTTEFDTETKEFVVAVDGVPVGDAEYVRFYKNSYRYDDDFGKWSMEVMSCSEGADKSRTVTSVTASRSVEKSVSEYLRS